MNLDKYIGIPYVGKQNTFEGCDCWGLINLFYKEEYGLDIPTYFSWYINVENLTVLDYTINENKNKGYDKVDTPVFGDIILFTIKGLVVHCGMYVGNGMFLHNYYKTNSCLEKLTSFKWEKRIEGYYRYTGK